MKVTESQKRKRVMQNCFLDASGLKCPQPVLKIAVISPDMRPGQMLEVIGDCPTFESDVRTWCERLKKTLVSVREEQGILKRLVIRF